MSTNPDMPRITVDGGRMTVRSPWLPEFPAKARKLGGRWNGDEHVWEFDARSEHMVRKLLVQVYGTDGEDHPGLLTLTLRATSDGFVWGGQP